MRAKIASGAFEPIGGSWVENDANMPSGEALVRQFVYGQRYFESRFGKRCTTAWLWPYSVTQQKVARSWSTQVDLMERYPEHRFSCSQAQQFKWLEEVSLYVNASGSGVRR